MLTYAVVTISDSASTGEREDKSGKIIQEMMLARGAKCTHCEVIPDEARFIENKLKELSDQFNVPLILTTGGTGFTERDVTPEVTRAVIEKEVPGFGEIMRIEGYKKTPKALLSRGISGIRGKTLIINLPGSSKGVRDSLELIFPVLEHGLGLIQKNTGHPEEASKMTRA